jgi:conjugative transposon protein TcpC
MARRPAVRHGSQTVAYDDDRVAPDPWGAVAGGDGPGGEGGSGGSGGSGGGRGRRPARSRRGGGRWAGAGGRWWVWVGRAILWAFIIVVLVNGIRAPFERFTSDGSRAPTATRPDAKAQFPSTAASAYALQFGSVYLNYDQRTAGERARQLQFFLPEGTDVQLGWNGFGQQQLHAIQVAGVEVRDANNAIITLLAKTQDAWYRLAVPIYAKDGALAVSGRPALLPPPPKAALPQRSEQDRDTVAERELQQPLEGFFKAYGSGDTVALSRFTDGGAVTGMAGSVTFVQLREVVAPHGSADRRVVTATVAWQIPSSAPSGSTAQLEQTYQLTVVKKDSNWYVRDINGSTQPTGS